ncbi:hypothetical protein RhiirC2_752522, partial [Rhizophagus irregularis]
MFLYIVNGQSQDIIIISVFSASFYWFISSDKIFSRKTITAIIITVCKNNSRNNTLIHHYDPSDSSDI